MRLIQSSVCVLTFCLAVSMPADLRAAEKETYGIDAVHSTALFGVQHLGAGRFYGRFNDVSGTIAHAEGSDADLQIEVSIATESVDTGNGDLDKHLKGPDFFNVQEFPAMSFKSTSASKIDDKHYEVAGDLTLHGVTRPIKARVEWVGTKAGRRGKRCGFETMLVINRSEYGMNYGVEEGGLGDETRIIVSMEAVAAEKESDRGASGGRGRGGNMLARFDANGDGKLQKDEVPERMKERFDDMDSNKDGALEPDELRAGRGGRRGGGEN